MLSLPYLYTSDFDFLTLCLTPFDSAQSDNGCPAFWPEHLPDVCPARGDFIFDF